MSLLESLGRRSRADARPALRQLSEDAPFSLGWVAELVWMERKAMRDVLLASLVLSMLTVLPALMVMTVIDQVVTHQSLSTLVLMSLLIGIALLSETALGYARRQLILIVGARVDAKLNLHVFQRLLRSAAGFFRTQPGRHDLVPDRPADQQDPGFSDRQAADHDARPGDPDRSSADPVLPAADAVLDGAGRRRCDRRHHRRLHETHEPAREALHRRRNGQIQRHGRDSARHSHGQIAGAGTAAARTLGCQRG